MNLHWTGGADVNVILNLTLSLVLYPKRGKPHVT